MVICPNCHAENRLGAKICSNCSFNLPDYQGETRPLNESERAPNIKNPVLNPPAATRRIDEIRKGGTVPVGRKGSFLRRPEGAIFGDHYLYKELAGGDSDHHAYFVEFLSDGKEMQVRVCPNPECGAIFPPRSETQETYCTDCGSVLEKGGGELVLIESRLPFTESVARVAAKGLSHGGVRAPLAAFVEQLGDEHRYCLVLPKTQNLGKVAVSLEDAMIILQWGASLGRGLEYLHDNGIHFNGQLDPSCIGLSGDKAVWVGFNNCFHHPEGYVTDRLADTRALASLVSSWLTEVQGRNPPMELSANVQRLLELTKTTDQVKNGAEFAQMIQLVIKENNEIGVVCLETGHRSDVGRVRELNEDSVMTFELNRTRKSQNQALGVYLVADGMGGHDSGEVASGLIVDIFAKGIVNDLVPSILNKTKTDFKKWLRATVDLANQEVYRLREAAGTDMGSTLVASLVFGNLAIITHVGDSRAYLIHDKKLQQLTTDHSLVERLIASKQITREDARHHPQRNIIYRTVGDKPSIDIEIIEQGLGVGDYLLLCSDGLSGSVEDSVIHQVIMNARSVQDACDALVKTANAAGGGDNMSVVLVKVNDA